MNERCDIQPVSNLQICRIHANEVVDGQRCTGALKQALQQALDLASTAIDSGTNWSPSATRGANDLWLALAAELQDLPVGPSNQQGLWDQVCNTA